MNQIYESESLGQGVVISDGGVGRYLTVILIVADELAQVLMERGLEDTFGLGWHLSCSLIIRIGDSNRNFKKNVIVNFHLSFV